MKILIFALLAFLIVGCLTTETQLNKHYFKGDQITEEDLKDANFEVSWKQFFRKYANFTTELEKVIGYDYRSIRTLLREYCKSNEGKIFFILGKAELGDSRFWNCEKDEKIIASIESIETPSSMTPTLPDIAIKALEEDDFFRLISRFHYEDEKRFIPDF